MLYVAATPRHLEDLPADMNADRSFLNKMKYADLYRVTFAPYLHSNFSVMGQRFLPESGYGNYDKDELSVANGWVETYVRRFLDAYLKSDTAGRAFLALPAAKTGAPAHLFTIYRTKAQAFRPPAPPSLQSWRKRASIRPPRFIRPGISVTPASPCPMMNSQAGATNCCEREKAVRPSPFFA
jgi:hypothetical protein